MEENKNALNDDELDEVNGGLILGQNLVFKQSRSGNGNSTSTKGQPSTKASNTLFVKSKTNSSSTKNTDAGLITDLTLRKSNSQTAVFPNSNELMDC